MKITNKIKALLHLNGKNFSDYARELGIKRQSLNTKANANAYKIYDLIKLADMTDCRLAFVDSKDNIVVKFDSSDIEE